MRRDLEHDPKKWKPVLPRNKRNSVGREIMRKLEITLETDSTQLKQSLAGLARRLHRSSAGAANQRGVLPDRQRFAEEIALHRVAALVGEEAELLLGFPALRDDRHFEAVAKADDGAHDRGRLRIASEIDDESAVDLDLVERKRLQIAERGIARSEIVHRDAPAER